MPSGPKKRKAAKRKKEKGNPHLDSPARPSGNGERDQDQTSSDGRESESGGGFHGDTGSPTSRESKETSSSDGVLKENREFVYLCSDPNSVVSISDRKMEERSDFGSVGGKQIVTSEGNGVSQKEEQVFVREQIEKEEIQSSVPHSISENEKIGVESSKKSDSSSSSDDGSSDSSSDEQSQSIESHSPEKKLEALGYSSPSADPVDQIVPLGNSVAVESSSVDRVDPTVSLLHEVEETVEVPIDYSGVLVGVGSSSNGIKVTTVQSSVEVQQIPQTDAVDTAMKLGEGAECCKDSEKPECSENEIVLAPQTERRASWRNCCGLLDVIMGSH